MLLTSPQEKFFVLLTPLWDWTTLGSHYTKYVPKEEKEGEIKGVEYIST